MPAATASSTPTASSNADGQSRHRPAQHHGQIGDREPSAEQRGRPQHLRRVGRHGAEPVSQHGGQRRRQPFPRGGNLGGGADLQRPFAHQGIDQLAHVQRIAGGLRRQLPQRIPGRCAEHRRHQGGHVGFGQRPQRDHRTPAAGDGRAELPHLCPARSRAADPDQQQPQLADRRGELVPDDQRRVVGPLQVVQDHDRGGGRAQLVHQPHQHLNAGHRRIAVREQPLPAAAEQAGGVRTPRVRRTRPHLKAVQHHAQRQPLGELARDPPPDIPPRIDACRQGLGDQRRLADAGLALDPDHRPLTTAEGLDTGTEDRELLLAAHPVRSPVNRPHASKLCPAQSRCPCSLTCTRDWMPSFAKMARRWAPMVLTAVGITHLREQGEVLKARHVPGA